jgi:hypothetical protein
MVSGEAHSTRCFSVNVAPRRLDGFEVVHHLEQPAHHLFPETLIAETVLVAQVIEGVAGADLIGLLAQQLQATAHRDPMVEGASQGDQGQMRGMEDTALVRGGFDFDIGPELFKGRLFPDLYRRRKARSSSRW